MPTVMVQQKVEVQPTGAALGADILGVDVARELSGETIDAIGRAWSDHLVLRFRGQRLDDDQLMRFSAYFGEFDWARVIAASRVKVRGEDRYIESAEEEGTEMSYNPEPPSASALYALEVPPAGGDTGFANMYIAYDTLPAALRHYGIRSKAGLPARFEPQQCGRAAARRAMGACDPPGADLVPAVAGRRRCSVGQSLHAAPPRRVRSREPAAYAPLADQRRPPVLTHRLDPQAVRARRFSKRPLIRPGPRATRGAVSRPRRALVPPLSQTRR